MMGKMNYKFQSGLKTLKKALEPVTKLVKDPVEV